MVMFPLMIRENLHNIALESASRLTRLQSVKGVALERPRGQQQWMMSVQS